VRVLEIAEAAPPLGARLRLVSWWMYGVGLLALAVSAIGDAGADGAGWAYGMVIAGVSCLWSGNVVGALGRWRTTFVYVGFHLSVALFLLANPVISSLGRIPFSSAPERRGASGALWLLALSLVAIRIGSEVFENRYRSPTSPRGRVPHQPNRWARRILFVATMVARGFAIVMTDYQGLGTPGLHTYVNRVAQGNAMLDAGRIQVAPLVAATYPLEQYAAAFEHAARGLKVILRLD